MLQNEHQLRHEIVRIGRLMYEKGFICASDGNISARLEPNRILITPSGLHKGLLEPEQLLVVDEAGQPVGVRMAAGRRLKPTSELPMHLEAYRQRPDIAAVVHAHPPLTIALSIAGIPMADCLLPEVIVFLGLIPTTEYATPSSEENVRAIRDFIANHDALVLQRHGSLTVGDSPMQAFMRLETMEQNARIALTLAQLGVRQPLPPAEVRKLLRQRQEMGLSRPGESAEFCAVCGVCHDGSEHAPTLRVGEAASGRVCEAASGRVGEAASGRVGEAASGRVGEAASDSVEAAVVRDLVAQVVRQTLGDAY